MHDLGRMVAKVTKCLCTTVCCVYSCILGTFDTILSRGEIILDTNRTCPHSSTNLSAHLRERVCSSDQNQEILLGSMSKFKMPTQKNIGENANGGSTR
jgi:hypothetical protein